MEYDKKVMTGFIMSQISCTVAEIDQFLSEAIGGSDFSKQRYSSMSLSSIMIEVTREVTKAYKTSIIDSLGEYIFLIGTDQPFQEYPFFQADYVAICEDLVEMMVNSHLLHIYRFALSGAKLKHTDSIIDNVYQHCHSVVFSRLEFLLREVDCELKNKNLSPSRFYFLDDSPEIILMESDETIFLRLIGSIELRGFGVALVHIKDGKSTTLTLEINAEVKYLEFMETYIHTLTFSDSYCDPGVEDTIIYSDQEELDLEKVLSGKTLEDIQAALLRKCSLLTSKASKRKNHE